MMDGLTPGSKKFSQGGKNYILNPVKRIFFQHANSAFYIKIRNARLKQGKNLL
jgi:hypothetical protein